MWKRWLGAGACILALLISVIGCRPAGAPEMTLEQKLVQKLAADDGPEAAPDDYKETPEDRILRLFLSSFSDGNYAVVNPETSIRCLPIVYTSDVVEWIYLVTDWLDALGCSNNDLVSRFFQENRWPSRLALKSSLEDGYYIDYDGRFEQYREEVSKKAYRKDVGWASFIRENFPRFNAFLTVSKVVYDSETGHVLILLLSKGLQDEIGEARTCLYFLEYKDGELKEIASQEIYRPQKSYIR